MDREDLRPAKFDAYYEGEHFSSCAEKKGYFHRWADDAFMDNSDNYYQRVVGIIEDIDGKVYKVPPEALTLFPKKSLREQVMEQYDSI